jgi:hypothetical protein
LFSGLNSLLDGNHLCTGVTYRAEGATCHPARIVSPNNTMRPPQRQGS